MTDGAASRQLQDSESESEDTVRVASRPPRRCTTTAGESSGRPARSGSRRPAKSPSTSPLPPAGKTCTPAPDKHIQSSKNLVAPNYKLSSIAKLTRSENYCAWRDISEYVLELFNCWNMVLGEETIDDYAEDDNDNFSDRYQYAATYFIQTVESQWLSLLATHKTPSNIWTALGTNLLEKTLHLSSTNSILFSIPSTIYYIFSPIISISTIPYGIDYTSDAPLPPLPIDTHYRLSFKPCSSHPRLKQPSCSVLFPNQGIISLITSKPMSTLRTITSTIN